MPTSDEYRKIADEYYRTETIVSLSQQHQLLLTEIAKAPGRKRATLMRQGAIRAPAEYIQKSLGILLSRVKRTSCRRGIMSANDRKQRSPGRAT
jgi:hypothetical protein